MERAQVLSLLKGFESWWKREEASGLALSDSYEVAVLRAVAEAAYKAGARKQKLLHRLNG
jgi:hypothetical protein